MDTADTVLGIMSFYRVLSLHHSMKTLTLIIIFSLATEADGVNLTHKLPVTDSPFQFTSPTVMITTEDTGQSTAIYVASTISLGVVLIAVTLGFIFFKHHKRHVTTITREPSDYYVNFSRAPKTNAEKTEISQKKEPIPLPPLNITQSGAPKTTIDEPVYGNVMPHNDVMDYSVDETDSVYANVDCSKP
ncbi:uncharacterized protein LOC124479635 isoform X5 [Hypomesus transpacificus]|uniref:uncharacterized protein LOC124479635 isoform X5 n=1 Tax=Hypomesus transpacificus TaxID=137520 RepID=UPI001F07F95E|nr:uncharacterized protein LOC124479635 isoform X5 [Hypomesus transpacificus]